MIEVYTFNKGKNTIKKADLKNKKGPAWIRVTVPDEQKLKQVSESTGIPIEELQESLEEEERPKVSGKEYLEIIYRAPSVVENELETLPLYFYILENKLVTIEKTSLDIIGDISKSFQKNNKKFLFKKDFSYFVYYVMDKINDDYLAKIERIAARIDIYENFSKKDLTVKDIEKVYDHSVTLSFFNQALIANVEVLNSLRKGYVKFIPRRNRNFFEELYYDVLQILDTQRIQRDAIANLINVYSILASTRLNEFMKKLTIIAIFIAIPTMISGLYGMNFAFIPLSEHPYGFYITTFFIILLTFGAYYAFTRIRE
jgi:magnesium transporter